MREGFALGFSLIAMHCWLRNKRWLFVVLILIALTAHVSAIIALLFPFARFKVTWKTLVIAILASLLLWGVSDVLIGRIFGLVSGAGNLAVKAMYYSLQTSSVLAVLVHDFRFLILPFVMMYTSFNLEPSEQL